MSASLVITAAAIGIGATLAMDLWNLVLKRAFKIPSLNYCLLGRWLRLMLRGKFRHSSIAAAPEQPLECSTGWLAHYSIGFVFALGFLLLAPGDWRNRPTLPPALLYGIATVVFPFFVLQPSLGFGIASSKSPHPARARVKSLGTHTVFGVGLYLSALGVGNLPGVRAECSSVVIADYPSPGNELKALVFQRSCEGGSGAVANLSILPFGATLRNAAGNVFVAEADQDGPASSAELTLGVQWRGRNRLQVTYDSRLRVITQRREAAAVVIEYQPNQRSGGGRP
jgi:hypothetical protein